MIAYLFDDSAPALPAADIYNASVIIQVTGDVADVKKNRYGPSGRKDAPTAISDLIRASMLMSEADQEIRDAKRP